MGYSLMAIYHNKKIKISILALHLGYGGIEKAIATLANSLCDYYEVELSVCYKLYDKPAFFLDNRVHIHYLNYHLKPNKDSFLDAFHKKNVFKMFKEGIYSIKVLYYRRKKMIQYICNTNADIIISTRDLFNKWVSQYASNRILRIGWEHNHFHGDLKYAAKVFNSAKKLDYLVLVSKELQKYYANVLKKYKCQAVYIPNSIDEMPLTMAPLKNKKIVCVGRLSPEKGHMDLLKVYSMINEKYSKWTLDIVGDGSERKKLENYIKKNHLEKRVFLHGFQQKEFINKLLNEASIYLMTSYTESFGIVLVEAMSHGVPCVAFESAEGATEIIKDGVNGFLIKNRDESAMVQKIEELIENRELRVKLGKQARDSVVEYSKEVVLKKWISLIKESGYYE